MSDDQQPKYFDVKERLILNDDDRRPIKQEQDGCINAASVLVFCVGLIAYLCL